VIGLAAEEELGSINFPEAYMLAASDAVPDEAFVEKAACHFYGKPFTVARTARLVIRESTGEDHSQIMRLLQECARGGVRIFSDGFDPEEIDTREKFLQYVNACYHFFGFGIWSVLLCGTDGGTDGPLIGWCGLFPKKDEGEEGHHIALGYAVSPAFWRQGYAGEACRAILSYAREKLGLKPEDIVVRTDPENAAAIALAKSLGLPGIFAV